MTGNTGSPGPTGPTGPAAALGQCTTADQPPPLALAAIDLGASSGRAMLGLVRSDRGHDARARLDLHAAHRFENRLERRDGHLSWDVDALWAEVRTGLSAARRLAVELGAQDLASIGVDSWAVDYGFVGPDRAEADGSPLPGSGERIGEVIAYRDERTEGVDAHLARRVSAERQFALTGIAQQPFNTLYQLASDDRLETLSEGSSLLLVPDLLAYLLTGERRTEVTNASTTGMFAAAAGDWVPELVDASGAIPSLLAPLVRPGERIGTLVPALAAQLGVPEVPVTAVGSHDTASAVLAIPAEHESAGADAGDAAPPLAFISSGTWSLIGLEIPRPVIGEEVRAAGFTNEGGVGDSVRFLKNVAGMWLVSESIRQWQEDADGTCPDLAELLAAAAEESPDRFRIDPTDPEFLPPGRMADRVVEAAHALDGSDARPQTPAEIVRMILESLAETYRDELRTACRLAGRPLPHRLHVVGGGSRNHLLNQLTAHALGIEVVAGPMEATAMGNLALQASSLGAIGPGPDAVRALVRESVELEVFRP
ncbi:rhamnulokinase [Brachybacterium endophyticum]|uniref:Rhamnulokinase n=1 Tax=Brachybacterium endophyticum TaxID=2182385 RepID=A0A2U2RK71_9MICO|nr:rhamnulokinase family protein [Brachybacterium endophyticum]PWH06263.1 rhamnulokinase [Brachybacterium endophyticum]